MTGVVSLDEEKLIFLLQKNLSKEIEDELSLQELEELKEVRANIPSGQWERLNDIAKLRRRQTIAATPSSAAASRQSRSQTTSGLLSPQHRAATQHELSQLATVKALSSEQAVAWVDGASAARSSDGVVVEGEEEPTPVPSRSSIRGHLKHNRSQSSMNPSPLGRSNASIPTRSLSLAPSKHRSDLSAATKATHSDGGRAQLHTSPPSSSERIQRSYTISSTATMAAKHNGLLNDPPRRRTKMYSAYSIRGNEVKDKLEKEKVERERANSRKKSLTREPSPDKTSDIVNKTFAMTDDASGEVKYLQLLEVPEEEANAKKSDETKAYQMKIETLLKEQDVAMAKIELLAGQLAAERTKSLEADARDEHDLEVALETANDRIVHLEAKVSALMKSGEVSADSSGEGDAKLRRQLEASLHDSQEANARLDSQLRAANERIREMMEEHNEEMKLAHHEFSQLEKNHHANELAKVRLEEVERESHQLATERDRLKYELEILKNERLELKARVDTLSKPNPYEEAEKSELVSRLKQSYSWRSNVIQHLCNVHQGVQGFQSGVHDFRNLVATEFSEMDAFLRSFVFDFARAWASQLRNSQGVSFTSSFTPSHPTTGLRSRHTVEQSAGAPSSPSAKPPQMTLESPRSSNSPSHSPSPVPKQSSPSRTAGNRTHYVSADNVTSVPDGEYQNLSEEGDEIGDELLEEENEAGTTIQSVSNPVSFATSNINQPSRQEKRLFHLRSVDWDGGVIVCCRIKPLGGFEPSVVKRRDDRSLDVVKRSGGERRTFIFDRVYDDHMTQADITFELSDLIITSLEGSNVSLITYGETGSGKTHTIDGTPGDPGVMPRMVAILFDLVNQSMGQRTFSISVSSVEVHKENVKDLLGNVSSETKVKQVKMDSHGRTFVTDATQVQIESAAEFERLRAFVFGRRLPTAKGKEGFHDSRAHCITSITIDGEDPLTGTKTFGKLTFVDMGGSEKLRRSEVETASGRDALDVNRGIVAFGDVVSAIASKLPYVPYRNSKLTQILQDSLSPNAKTVMIVTVNPVDQHRQESLEALNFGWRVKSCDLNYPKRCQSSKAFKPTKQKDSGRLGSFFSERSVHKGSKTPWR